MQAWLVIYLTLAALALAQGVLLTMQTWEHRRYARGRNQRQKDVLPPGRVALLAPCKGIEHGLEDNLRPLFEQDHPDYELILIVESERDPASEVIRQLLLTHPNARARLVVAGVATRSGQKVHNLLAATAELSPAVKYLAFVDSDARPRPEWLRWLVGRLGVKGEAVATAYRWFIPARASWANYLLYSLNCGVAMLAGPGRHTMVWGGSWAIRRETFDRIRLREAWHGTLSDDLVAARVLAAEKCRVAFEPRCMAASHLDTNLAGMFEFVRRQYTIGRCYSPRWWAGALVFLTFAQLVFWGSAVLAAVGLAIGVPWAWMPCTAVAALYALGTLRAALRQNASRSYLPQWQAALKRARHFDLWLHPLAALVNWLGMAASCRGRRIVWRGNSYDILPGGQIRLVPSGPLDKRVLPLPQPAADRRKAG